MYVPIYLQTCYRYKLSQEDVDVYSELDII